MNHKPFLSLLFIILLLLSAILSVNAQCFIRDTSIDPVDLDAEEESEKCDLFDPTADEIIEGNALAASLGVVEIDTLQKELCEDGNCKVSLCFALDGSGSVSPAEFQVQKDLVKILASLAAPAGASFSAVQYGLTNSLISSLNSNLSDFISRLQESQLLKAKRTFLAAGLGGCISQLSSAPQDMKKKVVVLGDGRANFAESSLSLVLAGAKGVDIFVVGVGFPKDSKALTEVTGGRKDRVLAIDKYSDVGNVVFKLARSICSVMPKN